MIHPHTEVRSIDEEIGHGVFATRDIPRGTITWARDALDREFSRDDVEGFDGALREVLEHYSYRTSGGSYFLCWDHTRYMNHSFRPNCLPTPYGFEIAVRSIAKGEELTNDYGCFNVVAPFRPRTEGLLERRDQVRPDDLLRHAPGWDRLIEQALRDLSAIEQPLENWVADEVWKELSEVAAGTRRPRSVAELYFAGGSESGDGIAASNGD